MLQRAAVIGRRLGFVGWSRRFVRTGGRHKKVLLGRLTKCLLSQTGETDEVATFTDHNINSINRLAASRPAPQSGLDEPYNIRH